MQVRCCARRNCTVAVRYGEHCSDGVDDVGPGAAVDAALLKRLPGAHFHLVKWEEYA